MGSLPRADDAYAVYGFPLKPSYRKCHRRVTQLCPLRSRGIAVGGWLVLPGLPLGHEKEDTPTVLKIRSLLLTLLPLGFKFYFAASRTQVHHYRQHVNAGHRRLYAFPLVNSKLG